MIKVGRNFEEKMDLGNGINLDLILIPPGKFWMGSPQTEQDRYENEARHKVLISKPFWCGKYPITQEQWQAVMKSNPSYFKGDPKRPVETVSWEDCQEFCKKTGLKLLTEAQWEYACRAGTTTVYSFGNDPAELDRNAWYDKNSEKTTHPVGQKQSNALGLHDMHGNVWEWCQDWYKEYPNEEQTDPSGLASGSLRVFRGGSWFSFASLCRSSYRSWDDPGLRGASLGFRLCRPYP